MKRLLAIIAMWPALAFGSAGDARPIPIRGSAYRLTFALFNTNTTALLGAAALDTECGLDAVAPTDCSSESVEIGDGLYYIELSAAEMTADTVTVAINTSSIPGPTIVTINPVDVTGADWPANSWDISLAAHLAAGSTGLALNSAGSSGDPWSALCSAYSALPTSMGYLSCLKLGLIGTGLAQWSGPVAPDGTKATIIRCNDYSNLNGQALDWSPPSGTSWTFDLTGAVVHLYANPCVDVSCRQVTTTGGTSLDVTGSVVTPTGPTAKIRFQPTSVQTCVLNPLKMYKFQAVAVLPGADNIVGGINAADDKTVTPAMGFLTVLQTQDPTP